ncbi:DUF342 domain-containing protein [bacterium]|jgi:uncharacterized protein|nr:DUF342 domain-containing protein [bacterium]
MLEDGGAAVYHKQILNRQKDIMIGITKAGIAAFVSLVPTDASRRYSSEEIEGLLRKDRILYGIKKERIKVLVKQANAGSGKVRDEIIAEGKPPTDGISASIKYHFKTRRFTDFEEDEHGRVDYKDLRLVNNVSKGELLAEKVPMVPGATGLNIYGETVSPKKVRDAEIIVGSGISLSKNRLKATSELDGHVYLDGNRVVVSQVFVVPHDVDLNIGNIDTNGSILVHGNVLAGFTLNAKLHIEVRGIVEGANLLAGGNIACHGGVKAGSKGLIQADGSVFVAFAEAAYIICGGSLKVQSSLVNCQVSCDGKALVRSVRGCIVGGEIQATQGIIVQDLGSRLGVTTRVIIGDKPFLLKRLKEISVLIQNAARELKITSQSLEKLKPILKVLKKLPPEKRERVERILQKHHELADQIKELTTKEKKLSARYKVPCSAALKVTNIAHPNIFLSIGHSEKTTRLPEKNVLFRENPRDERIESIPMLNDRDDDASIG